MSKKNRHSALSSRSPTPSGRREFLGLMGSGALAGLSGCDRNAEPRGRPPSPQSGDSNSKPPAAAEPNEQTESATEKAPLGVALLGLGSYATEQLAPGLELTKHCRLTGIVTGSPSKIPSWQKKYGIDGRNVYSYETLPSIAQNDEIDVVYIVVPTGLHAKYAIMAANAGKHVWCEKPMAMNVDECRAIISACEKNKVTLSIGYRMQHEPNTRTIIEYAKSRPYGAIKRVEALAGYAGGGADTWRLQREMGGGALYDMGVYCINAARYSTGEEPTLVRRAKQWTDRPKIFDEVDETTEFDLEFPSGATANCRTSVGESINRLEVTCARGSYHLEPMQSYTGVSGSTSDGTKLDKEVEHQQARQMDDDALGILEQRAVMVPGEEGLRDIRIVQAIMESARSGQPVKLPG